MLVRVLTDVGGPKPVALIARVVEERDTEYVIQFLSLTEDRDHNRTVYKYEDETYDIDEDYIVEYYDDEYEAGFTNVADDGWVKESADSDYVPSSGEEDDDEEDGEDEEEDDENEEYYDENYIDND